MFQINLYPLTLERSARLNQVMLEYEAAILRADEACDDEINRVDEECTLGREQVKGRFLEAIEERRRRAREEKESEGTMGMLVYTFRIDISNSFK